MKKTMYHITVEGAGDFPIDMLRYDQCWPDTERDTVRIMEGPAADTRRVNLLSHTIPTPGRWESFGWSVVKS